jgi:hypothetical protein
MSMKTVGDLIRDSDPLSHEPIWSQQDRRAVRQNVLRAAADVMPSVPALSHPLVVLLSTLCLLLVAGAAIMPRSWSPLVLAQASVRFEIRLAEESPASGLQPADGTVGTIYLHKDAIVTNRDIAAARVVAGGPSGFGVEVTFTPQAAGRISQATRAHVGKPIAILVDGKIVAAPNLKSPVSASALISGDFALADAERIADGMIGR